MVTSHAIGATAINWARRKSSETKNEMERNEMKEKADIRKLRMAQKLTIKIKSIAFASENYTPFANTVAEVRMMMLMM